MLIFCKQCNYSREHMGEYEDYECPLCGNIMNKDKEEFFDSFKEPDIENETIGMDEVIKIHIISSFKRDIQEIGKERTWQIIEGLSNARTRIRYRKFYFLALEELKKEV